MPAEVIDSWLEFHHISRAQYLQKVVNRKSSIDGLFVWMAAWACDVHLNMLHASGIWTTYKLDIPVFTDPGIVFIVRCFLAVPAMHLGLPKDESDSEFLRPFGPPPPGFITVPLVLNKPVTEVQERLDETRMVCDSDEAPLQELFAEHSGCTVEVF